MSLLSRSIFLLYDDVLGFFPSLEWKMYSPSVPVINLMSFGSKPTLFILLCNTRAGLCGHVSLLPAGLILGFDNRSVGGTMQAWERDMIFFRFLVSVSREADQYAGAPAAFYRLWGSIVGVLRQFLHHCAASHMFLWEQELFSEVWIQQFRTPFSEFLSLFLVPLLSPRYSGCLQQFLPLSIP